MDSIERDDFVHSLTQTMNFFGKDVDRMQVSFWVTACKDKSVTKLKLAFMDHVKSGRYAPRPADILSIVDNMAKTGNGRNLLPAPPTTNCPPEIAAAWTWFIGRITKNSDTFQLFQDTINTPVDLQEKYLHIVNHEAHTYSMPESIPDEFKLREVWGEAS